MRCVLEKMINQTISDDPILLRHRSFRKNLKSPSPELSVEKNGPPLDKHDRNRSRRSTFFSLIRVEDINHCTARTPQMEKNPCISL